MKFKIIDNQNEKEVVIHCKSVDDEVNDLIEFLLYKERKLMGLRDGKNEFIPLTEILYFESIEGRTFFYTTSGEFESRSSLTYFEENLGSDAFIRISKNTLVNIKRICRLQSLPNMRIMATLESGEKIIISRFYSKGLRARLLRRSL